MQLTPEQKARLEAARGDWEVYHSIYDELMEARLKELDPQFVDYLEEIKTEHDATFWYA